MHSSYKKMKTIFISCLGLVFGIWYQIALISIWTFIKRWIISNNEDVVNRKVKKWKYHKPANQKSENILSRLVKNGYTVSGRVKKLKYCKLAREKVKRLFSRKWRNEIIVSQVEPTKEWNDVLHLCLRPQCSSLIEFYKSDEPNSQLLSIVLFYLQAH